MGQKIVDDGEVTGSRESIHLLVWYGMIGWVWQFHYIFIDARREGSAFAKNQVESERKDIDCVESTIAINGQSMRAVTKVRSWNKDHKLYTHIYYNAKKATGIREELYTKVALLCQEVLENPEKYLTDEEAKKYLIIRKSEKSDRGYTVNIRTDVVEKSLTQLSQLNKSSKLGNINKL